MIRLERINAITEMSARAEQLIMRIRSELFRVGCPPENFSVTRCGPHVRMCYRNILIECEPHEVLVALRGTPTGTDKDDVWRQMTRHGCEQAQQGSRKFGWVLAAATATVLLLVLMTLLFF